MHVDSSKGFTLFIRESGKVLHAKSAEESVRRAFRVARQKTKRRKIVNVLPADYTETNPGIKDSKSHVTVYTNHISNFCRALATSEARVAAVVVTPDERDLKYKGFLREIRELTSAEGALLIWKEVEGNENAENENPREFFGIQPDIICWSGNEKP